jgi:hypothetical protein
VGTEAEGDGGGSGCGAGSGAEAATALAEVETGGPAHLAHHGLHRAFIGRHLAILIARLFYAVLPTLLRLGGQLNPQVSIYQKGSITPCKNTILPVPSAVVRDQHTTIKSMAQQKQRPHQPHSSADGGGQALVGGRVSLVGVPTTSAEICEACGRTAGENGKEELSQDNRPPLSFSSIVSWITPRRVLCECALTPSSTSLPPAFDLYLVR